MEEDLQLGLCIIKVLCLIVIAMSVHKLAYSAEPMTDRLVGASGMRFAGVNSQVGLSGFSGDGQYESPVFWNQGSVEETNAALQAASHAPAEGLSNRDVKNLGKLEAFTNIENIAGMGY